MNYNKMKKAELKDLLEIRGMNASGTKAEMVARLQEAHAEALKELPKSPPSEIGYSTHEATVERIYQDVLKRGADPGGLSHYADELAKGKGEVWLRDILETSAEAQALKDLEARSASDGEE